LKVDPETDVIFYHTDKDSPKSDFFRSLTVIPYFLFYCNPPKNSGIKRHHSLYTYERCACMVFDKSCLKA